MHALLVLLILGLAGDSEPEQLFRAMEKKISAAKALEVSFNGRLEGSKVKGAVEVKGSLLLAEGNKARFELSAVIGDQASELKMISDGTRMKEWQKPGRESVKDTEKHLNDQTAGILCRPGFISLAFFAKTGGLPSSKKADQIFQVSEFKLGAKEKVGARQGRAIEYKVSLPDGRTLPVKLWIDAETHLPLKRVITGSIGKDDFQMTEVYEELRLDPKIDPKRFHVEETAGLHLTLNHHSDYVTSVAFSSDGELLASAGPDGVRLVDLKTGKQVRTLDHFQARSVTLSKDRKTAVSTGWTGDQSVRLWDLETGKELRRFGDKERKRFDDKERKFDDKEPERFTGYDDPIHGAALSADGKRFLFGTGKTPRLLDLRTGKELKRFEGHTDVVHGVALSADGKRSLSCSLDTTVRVWDNESGKEVKRFEGHKDAVWCVILSPDGQRAASAGKEAAIKIWESDTGKELRQLEGHSAGVHGLAFSRDGERIASAGYDNVVRVWDAATGKELRRFEGHTAPVYDVAFSADGRYVASGGADKSVRVWRAPK